MSAAKRQGESWECIGFDSRNVPRVWAKHLSRDLAESACVEEARRYVARRHDTGPLDSWHYSTCRVAQS